jgi:hypothetical protein
MFNSFVEEQKKEDSNSGTPSFKREWKPEKGTADKPNSYEIRFLPDVKTGFYKKQLYHMFQVDGKWAFYQCPKTTDFNNPCPICSVVQKLYQGSEDDKKEARRLKRKQKFISNIFVAHDPRDVDKETDDKAEGKIKLYGFPAKVEALLKQEITDVRNGLRRTFK